MKITTALFIKYRFLVLVLIFAVFAALPLLHPGLIPTQDGEYHLIRFYEFNKMLLQGYWYPRWAPDLNFSYGIPLFTYNYPLPNYIASLFHLFGASFLDNVKLNMLAATLFGSILFFLWLKRFWGNVGALVGSVYYTYAPYHFVDIYVRGSVGEVWALALFPGFLWTYTAFVQTKKIKYVVCASVFLSLTIFSHNILGLMFFTFALTYCAFLIFQSKEKLYIIRNTLYIILLGLGLSAIFWIPALLETKYVIGLQIYDITQNFPDLFQLLFPSWGNGFFNNDLTNQMSVQIGVANLLVIFASCIGSIILFVKRKRVQPIILFFLFAFFCTCFLMLRASLPLWLHVPLIHYFQFPWRLLSLVILISAFLAGWVANWRKSKIIPALLLVFIVTTTYSYTKPAYYMLRNDTYYVTRSNFIDSTNSPGNSFNTIWNQTHAKRPASLFLTSTNVKNIRQISSIHYFVTIGSLSKNIETLNISYFPNWFVFINGKSIKTFPVNGLLSFSLTPGKHTYEIVFLQTPLEIIATGISIISFFFLVFILLKKNRNRVQ